MIKNIIIVLLTIFGIGCISTFVAGLAIISVPYDFENLPNFADTQCTPINVNVAKMENCGSLDYEYGTSYYSEYVAVWECKESGASIIENPFAGNRQKSIAKNNMDDYPLNVIQNVSCNNVNLPAKYPNLQSFYQCQVWNTCFFDVAMIKDFQENALERYNKGYHLLYATAALAGVLAILFIIFLIVCFNCFNCKRLEYI